MKKPKAPCLGCTDRHVGCHGESCPNGWLEYRKQYEEFVKVENAEKEKSIVAYKARRALDMAEASVRFLKNRSMR